MDHSSSARCPFSTLLISDPCPVQDVGFDYAGKGGGGKDNQIIDVYFHHHFPKAVSPSLLPRPAMSPRAHMSSVQHTPIALSTSTHCQLDVLTISNVMQINTSRELRQRGGPERYRYMTQVQLIHPANRFQRKHACAFEGSL